MKSNTNNVGYSDEVWKRKLSKMSIGELVSVILGYEDRKQTDVYKQTIEELRGRAQEEIDEEERRITKQWDQASREIDRVLGEIKQKEEKIIKVWTPHERQKLKSEWFELYKELIKYGNKWKEMYGRLKVVIFSKLDR